MTAQYTNWEDAPLMLNAADISKITGLSKPIVYDMMKMEGFPTIRMSSKRLVVPKDGFKKWIDKQSGNFA